MHSRLAAGLAGVLMIALAGCVGIPTSGVVEAGPPFDEQVDPDLIVLPSGPVPGSDQQRILLDFMQAVRSPRDDYSVAQQFMTPELADRWDPDESAIVRTSASALPSQDAANTWLYTVTTRASLNADGIYSEQPEPSNQTLAFSFEQIDGEWRISEAPNGVVLSESSFASAFQQQVLYFFDASHRYLVPDVRWFPARARIQTRVVDALLAGPAEWLQQGVLQTAFPAATKLGDPMQVSGNTAVVDLSVEALGTNEQERDWMRQQLVATLGTPNVRLTVAGRDLPTPGGPVAAINPPVTPATPLVGDGEAFGFDGGSGIVPIDGLSEAALSLGITAAVLSADRQLLAFRTATGAVGAVTTVTEPIVFDTRPGLAPPSLDPFGFVWSVQAASAASLTTWGPDGAQYPVQSGLPADAAVASVDVSRDGTRILLYTRSPAGTALYYAGIIRQDGAPIKLGPLQTLPVGQAPPLDAAWVDDRTVAALAATGDVTAFEIGGPSVEMGTASDATTIVGGNNGTDGIRVLAGGEVLRPQGAAGWVSTGIPATLLATKQ